MSYLLWLLQCLCLLLPLENGSLSDAIYLDLKLRAAIGYREVIECKDLVKMEFPSECKNGKEEMDLSDSEEEKKEFDDVHNHFDFLQFDYWS